MDLVYSLLSGLVGAVVAIFSNFLIQKRIQNKSFLNQQREKLIFAMTIFSGFIDQVFEFGCQEEEMIDRTTKNDFLMYNYYNALYKTSSEFLSAYKNYNFSVPHKQKLKLEKEILDLQNDLYSAFAWAAWCPEGDARKNLSDLREKYNNLFGRMSSTLSD